MIAQTPQLFSAKNYQNWLMNVEDTASQISVIFGIQHTGSAETLARGGEIINHRLIAYSLSNISAKKLLKLVNMR